MRNIVLIGMSGAGKSTIGVLLAKALGKDFIDTDILIQQKEKRLLQSIIDSDGTGKFLQTEESVVCSLDARNSVIATGGSAVYSEKAMTHLKKNGFIIYLYVPYEELSKRLTSITTRGIVMKEGSTLKDVYDERLPLYRRYADRTIDCSGMSVEESVTAAVRASAENQQLSVRLANCSDIGTIMKIYDTARMFMRQHGNSLQWINGYPQRELVEDDIRQGHCFVCTDCDGTVHGVFAFIIGDDPTYRIIRNGSWLNNDPYGTIHRIGSDGSVRGVFTTALDFCRNRIACIRADTHKANLPMQATLEKHGFIKCGIIKIQDGSDRVAYQYTQK